MFSSWKIGKIFGIRLFIHWTFWLLPLWLIFTEGGRAEQIGLGTHLLLLAALFSCVVLHELGHALAARSFGIDTLSITLSPLGGIAQLERMSKKPWEEFCIASAGPLVNVVLAILLGAILVVSYAANAAVIDLASWQFTSILLALNVVMVIFNLLPAFPMDGGRILRALLAQGLGLLTATRLAVAIGTATALLMGLGGALFLGNPWLIFIALFVIFAGNRELRVLEWEERRQYADQQVVHVRSALQVLGAKVATTPVSVWIWDARRGMVMQHSTMP